MRHGGNRFHIETADTEQVVDIPGDHLALSIGAFDEAVTKSSSAGDIIAEVTSRFPNYGNPYALVVSAHSHCIRWRPKTRPLNA